MKTIESIINKNIKVIESINEDIPHYGTSLIMPKAGNNSLISIDGKL